MPDLWSNCLIGWREPRAFRLERSGPDRVPAGIGGAAVAAGGVALLLYLYLEPERDSWQMLLPAAAAAMAFFLAAISVLWQFAPTVVRVYRSAIVVQRMGLVDMILFDDILRCAIGRRRLFGGDRHAFLLIEHRCGRREIGIAERVSLGRLEELLRTHGVAVAPAEADAQT